ncbi:class I SAM-dependent methyltransferase [Patescibacteria group bacterium]|nr:class I SAM-dependent methyltransferase [Patescibacteria group bacterium]
MNKSTTSDNNLVEIQKVNRATYDNLANEYEQRNKTLKNVTEYALSLFIKHLSSGKEILETGCAVGLAINIMERKGLNVTGIDISPKMVKYAKKRNPKSDIVLGDFLTYKFGKKYDGIFSFAFIHLFPKNIALKILKKMYELLKSGGVLYLGTSRSKQSYESWEVKKDYQNKKRRFRKHWTQKELENALIETGFKKLDLYIIEDPFKKVWMDFVVQKP